MLELTIRLIVSLAIVVGLLLLLARLSARRFGSQKGALVQVVHRQPLSRTSAVSVVSVGSRVLVLGTTEHKINVLAELDPTELEDEQALPSDATVLELVGAPDAGLPEGWAQSWAPAEVAALLGQAEADADIEATAPADVRRPRAPGHHRATDRTTRRRATRPAGRPAQPATGALAGSVLSPHTWRQAIAVVTRRAS